MAQITLAVMPRPLEKLNEKVSVVVSPSAIFVFTLVFGYIVTESKGPLRESGAALLCLFFLWVAPKLYPRNLFRIEGPRWEFLTFFAFTILGWLAYGERLEHSLVVDELWHGIKSNFLLNKVSQWVNALTPLAPEAAREGFWTKWDFRVLPAPEVWRILSVGFWLFLFLCWKLAVRIRELPPKPRWIFTLALLAAAVLLFPILFQANIDTHPPLRLLPWFLGQLIFGLNDFALRFTTMLTWSLFATWIFLFLRKRSVDSWLAGVAAASTLFIPQVFHSFHLVEPSGYGFIVWTSVLLLFARFLSNRRPEDLLRLGVLIGVGTLFRQPAVVLWCLPALGFLILPKNEKTRALLAGIFLPGLLNIHYFVTAKVLGHSVADYDLSVLSKLIQLWTDGESLRAVLDSTTWPWLAGSLAMVFFLVKRDPKSLFTLAALPVVWTAYLMLVVSALWPAGRYQAEYIAAFVALLIISAASVLRGFREKIFFSGAAVWLAFCTLGIERDNSLDILYKQNYQMRLSSTFNFPFRQAERFIKISEHGVRFAYLGGTPALSPFSLWLSGFSLMETEEWIRNQDRFQQDLKGGLTAAIQELSKGNKAYLLVLEGTRREHLHRSQAVQDAFAELSKMSGQPGAPLHKTRTFGPEFDGWIDLYEYNP